MKAFEIAYQKFEDKLEALEEKKDAQSALEFCMALEFLGKTARALYMSRVHDEIQEKLKEDEDAVLPTATEDGEVEANTSPSATKTSGKGS